MTYEVSIAKLEVRILKLCLFKVGLYGGST